MPAGGILVGKYVVFVHDLKHVVGTLSQDGLPVSPAMIGYTDTRVMVLSSISLGLSFDRSTGSGS